MKQYSGSYLGSHRTGKNGEDMTYTYPPNFVMTFPKYRKQSSWDRDTILNKALLEYVNRPEKAAPLVNWNEGKPTFENINKANIPTGIEGGALDPETTKKVEAMLPIKHIPEKGKLGGFAVLMGALVMLWYFLFGNIKRR
jgi:hypothetical protein